MTTAKKIYKIYSKTTYSYENLNFKRSKNLENDLESSLKTIEYSKYFENSKNTRNQRYKIFKL